MPPNAGRRTPWLVSMPEYKEFVEICERAGWHDEETLPRAGAREARESGLEAFIAKGLGGQRFTRQQLNLKFQHWKDSNKSEKEIRLLDESKIASTGDLLDSVRKLDVYQIAAARSMAPETSSTYQDLVDSEEGSKALDDLRTRTISSMNKVLKATHSKKRSEMYFQEQSNNYEWFKTRWVEVTSAFLR